MNDFIIKKKRGSAPITMVFSLILLGASIFCLFTPVLNEYEDNIAMFIYASGGIGTFYFGYLAVIKLLLIISPGNGLIFTQEGIYDFTLPDGGAGFVGWDAVGVTKIYGTKKAKFIGIEVQRPKKAFKRVKKRAYAEIMSNVETGMPALVIDCRRIDAMPTAIAEEIAERKQEFSQMSFATQITNKSYQDHSIKRQGKATLEEDNRNIVTESTIDVVTAPKEQPIDAVDEFKRTDEEIEKILESINSPTKEAPLVVNDTEVKEEKESTNDAAKNVEYRDYGLLFANDDDDK